jgi:hypothetical protein
MRRLGRASGLRERHTDVSTGLLRAAAQRPQGPVSSARPVPSGLRHWPARAE